MCDGHPGEASTFKTLTALGGSGGTSSKRTN